LDENPLCSEVYVIKDATYNITKECIIGSSDQPHVKSLQIDIYILKYMVTNMGLPNPFLALICLVVLMFDPCFAFNASVKLVGDSTKKFHVSRQSTLLKEDCMIKLYHGANQQKWLRSSSMHFLSNFDDAKSQAELDRRMNEIRRDIIKEQADKPPKAGMSARDFIKNVLAALRAVDDPLPDYGCIVLLRSSTPRWKREILNSIAAPNWADEAHVASTLNAALGRKRNQFGILVGGAEGEEGEEYTLQFPSDAVEDLEDGTCWVECRFREPETGKLLAVTGWELKRRKQDGAWLIDRLDWQDFRDEYRPGFGREEWIRVFG